MKAFFRETLVTLVLAVAIFFTLQYTVQSFIVVGSSMQPTLHDGQRMLVNKVVYSLHEPERGDVIVFQPPNGTASDYVKRIIALPGESVEIKDGTVYIHQDDKVFPLNENGYIAQPPSYTLTILKVPQDSYFVLGDNRNNSNDSHNKWTVPRQNIIGKAWLSIWPPKEWGIVPNHLSVEQPVASRYEGATTVAE